MEQEKLIIDYIIEQAERFDIKNLQFEEDIKFNPEASTNNGVCLAVSVGSSSFVSVGLPLSKAST